MSNLSQTLEDNNIVKKLMSKLYVDEPEDEQQGRL